MTRARDLARAEIIGSSPGIVAALARARQVAPTDLPVLIVGETGTGKELLARLVHQASGRPGPLVDVDCGALPDELIESLLFGHRRGAFTGAVEHSRGLIPEAHQGTLFMDELGSLSPRGQAKLLRVLETGAVRRVGEAGSHVVDFRLVATAQVELSDLIRSGHFRQDLMQRVSGVVIRLPSLGDRGNDVPLLARHFAQSEGLSMDDEAVSILARREWPGNIRELKWMVARSVLCAADGRIGKAAVEIALEMGPRQRTALEDVRAPVGDAMHLRALCREHSGDPDEVARAMGISRSTLYRRVRQAGLDLRAFKRSAATA